VTREVRLREVLASVEGLALLRRLYEGSDEEAAARIAELRAIVCDDGDPVLSAGVPMREVSTRDGYAEWAPAYDAPGNAIVRIEEPVVARLLAAAPPGPAVDVACGTGRHSAGWARRGHRVVGIDASPEMLARVLRPGGRLVVSVLHPTLVALGWHAPYETPDGPRGFVREHDHLHGDYLRAFDRAGLRVVECVEPRFTEEGLPSKRRAMQHIPEATRLAYEGLPAVLVWGLTRA
jgi:SAM-dependent methyltransferase